MYYIIINDNKDIIILKNCRSVETYINSLDYKEQISHTSVSRRLRNENVINFKDLQIYSSDSLDKYIVVDKEKQTICFLENLRSIEEYIKENEKQIIENNTIPNNNMYIQPPEQFQSEIYPVLDEFYDSD